MDQIQKPQVSVYSVSRRQLNGKRVLLCQARGMFPDLVRFTWRAENQRGQNVELKDDEVLEQRDEDQDVRITSMLIVDRQKTKTNNFTCSVQHDSSFDDQRVIIPQAKEEEENITNQGLFELSHNLYLYSVTYVMLLVKNVLYFCTVSVLLQRNAPSNRI